MNRDAFEEKIWQIFISNGISPDSGDPIGAIKDIVIYLEQELNCIGFSA
jgi:hypothetical protein